MNNKLIKGGLAGVACLALAAGGSTFASWSDFGVTSNSAGAGILKLNISDRQGTTSGIEPFSLAPGQNKDQDFYLASADSDNVPNGQLRMQIQHITDTEDNGPACTTNSEAIAEAPGDVDTSGNPTNPSNDCGAVGELSSELRTQILWSDPVAGAANCPNTGPYSHHASGATYGATLANLENVSHILGNVGPGEGICVRVEMSLPTSADNLVQGDDVSFDYRFDLQQVDSAGNPI